MGLEGTLQAFSVADLLQMLGLQKKTGVLTIEGSEDSVTVSFLGGQIVSADSVARGLQERTANLLVRSGKLTAQEMVRVLELQKATPQRLGSLIARERLVRPEDLAEAFRLQIFRIVLGALRWKEGRFRFRQGSAIDSEPALEPIPTDSVLLEAVQWLEESPRLDQKISSRDLVFRRAPGVENLILTKSQSEAAEGVLVASRREAEIWRWVDGRRRVGEILDRAFLSDYDGYRGLADLIDRDLIVETHVEEPSLPPPPPARRLSRLPMGAVTLWAVVLAVLGLGASLAPHNSWNLLFASPARTTELADVFKSASLARLSAIERAVRVYYDSTGQYPKSVGDLTRARILDPWMLLDPWGRPYRYVVRPESSRFGIYGRNAAGDIDLDLSFDRTLAPVSEARPEPAAPKPPEAKPGIKVLD